MFSIFREGTYKSVKACCMLISMWGRPYRRLHAAAAVRQSANYGSVCRGEERSEYLQESWHRRPAPRSRDQCQKHDLGVTALSFSSAVSRTQAAARNIWCGVFDVLCCVVRTARYVASCWCLMCCLMFHVLSVLSGVWRSGRRARPQLPPPSTTSGVEI